MKPKKILIIGSGALHIGQGGEFDYSGCQAIKAIREEKIECVVLNPNIATIQTDPSFAGTIYLLPIEPYFVEKVIQKELIDAILLQFGGQAALNCGLVLHDSGILHKYQVQVLGTPIESIRFTEDRQLFAKKLQEINIFTPRSRVVLSCDEAINVACHQGFPVMIRTSFSLGGMGSAIVYNEIECRKVAQLALSFGSPIVVEESLKGWKEIEYEVMRDSQDNCVTICNMENIDPMGIHTGESIVVAPSQTLNDHEYQFLRNLSIKAVRHLGIIGECNIQFAFDARSGQYRVIEVNARLSRSSALASKATGYPLAYVAAKVALGYSLAQIKNKITQKTTAFFEPSLDYIVCKIPRWDLEKFDFVEHTIGTEMKSVGEVMGIGRSFGEAFQKAVRMLDIGRDAFDMEEAFEDVQNAIKIPTPKRIFAIIEGIKNGLSVADIEEWTGIDPFFLHEIKGLVTKYNQIHSHFPFLDSIGKDLMLEIKRAGFSDRMIGRLVNRSEESVRKLRKQLNIHPFLSQIDTFAGEYPAHTNFLYFSYSRQQGDFNPEGTHSNNSGENKKRIIVLGAGCYRIGTSVEFDWCTVHTIEAAKELGFEVIVVNNNPSTVSTDYDICDYLIFEEISVETILELYELFDAYGVIVSVGGQTSNNLALQLHEAGINILGTHPKFIDQAEDRQKFSTLLDHLNIAQPKWSRIYSRENVEASVASVGGFPILVRPSYVLSGAAMGVAYSFEDLDTFLINAFHTSGQYPVILSKYEENAREVELDAVANNGEIVVHVIEEHIENAGTHSGDATLVVPPFTLKPLIISQIKEIGVKLASQLQIKGPFNVQFLVKNDLIMVIECNLRASRSFPFASKATGINLMYHAACSMLGKELNTEPLLNSSLKNSIEQSTTSANVRLPSISEKGFAIKMSKFSFERLKKADPIKGVKMRSTGEVAGFGNTLHEALLSALLSTGIRIPSKGIFISCQRQCDLLDLLPAIRHLQSMGLKLFASKNTQRTLNGNNILFEEHEINYSMMTNFSEKIDLVICISNSEISTHLEEAYLLRRLAVDLSIPLLTNLEAAQEIIPTFNVSLEQIPILSLQDWQK